MYEVEQFRPVSKRRRALIALLAVAMAAFLVWSVTRKSGVVRNAALHPADVAVCANGQTGDCVGSLTTVIAAPPPASAAAASR